MERTQARSVVLTHRHPPSPTVTSASGSLYGPESLLGEVAKPSSLSGGDSAIVSNYPLVNGQEADKNLGLYLDFNSVENPQALRGDGGQTDPGPSRYPIRGDETLCSFYQGPMRTRN